MKKLLLTLGICICTFGVAVGQTQILIEDFEDGTVEYTTSITEFTDGGTDYFQRTTSPTESLLNIQGSGIFEAQDIDGEGASSQQTLTIDDINISGFTSLEFRIYLAEGDDGSNQDWDDSDFFHVDYDIDNSATFTELLWVEGGGGTNTAAFIDTDFDGTGDGTEITNSFVQFTQSISGTGSTLDIRLTFDLNSGDEDIAIDNIEVYGTSAGGAATKLSITDVHSGEDPVEGETFSVTVQSQDGDDLPANVSGDQTVTLSATDETGTLSGTLSGTITDGTNSVTFSGLSYDVAETFTLNATNTGGSLTADTESVTILTEADQLVIKDFPATGFSSTVLSSFTVEAQRSSDDSIDETYTEDITITKVTGSGTLGGTVTRTAIDGVATFDDITFSTNDSYAINAGDGTLTSSTSSSITVTTINSTPTVGDLYITEYSDGDSFSNEFIEIYNASDGSVNIAGYVLRQQNSTQSYTFGSSTIISSGSTLVLARNNSQANFESEWGALPSDVTYINSEDDFPQINGGENYLLEDGSGTNVDPATDDEYTAVSLSSGQRVYRTSSVGNLTGSWTSESSDNGTPGSVELKFVEITGNAGWRMLSFPTSGGAAEDISDNTAIQGVSGGDNTGETSNFLTYDNTGAFETPASVSTNLGNGYGFITYFYNNTDAGSSTLPITLDVSGTEPSSDVSVDLNVSTTDGGTYYTMVGNPYASNFNLNSITATGGSIQNNVAFWNNGTGSYSTQDRTTPYIVEPWQGFWVETTSDAVTAISLPTSGKTETAATGTFFSKENPEEGDLNFTLTSESTYDEAIRLSVRANASLGYDLDDASKFTPLTDSYATMAFVGEVNSEEKLQSVFSIPSQLDSEITIPLKVTNVNSSGEFTFAWDAVESMPEGWDLELIDYDTGNSVSLRTNESYTFEVEETQTKSTRTVLAVASTLESDKKESRFGLIITPGTSVGIDDEIAEVTEFKLDQNYPNPFNPSTTIKYAVGENGPVNITIYNVMGQKVAELLNTTKTAGNYQVTWNASGVSSGIYYYRLTAPGQILTRQMTLIK